jgi:putative transposase
MSRFPSAVLPGCSGFYLSNRPTVQDKKGIPLSAIITAANIHDVVVAIKTLDSIVISRRPIRKKKQNLCLDRGYYSAQIEHEIVKRRYIPHIRHRGEKKKHGERKGRRRRWVVERTNSWHNRFRKLLIRYEKKSENYLGIVQLACCMIVYRRILLG